MGAKTKETQSPMLCLQGGCRSVCIIMSGCREAGPSDCLTPTCRSQRNMKSQRSMMWLPGYRAD